MAVFRQVVRLIVRSRIERGMCTMTLQELIDALAVCDSRTRVPLGFGYPHSYRGCYDELAFEPVRDTTVGAMLAAARAAMGATYQGYKGGSYTMQPYTEVWIAEHGHTGEGIGLVLLAYMTGDARVWQSYDERIYGGPPYHGGAGACESQ